MNNINNSYYDSEEIKKRITQIEISKNKLIKKTQGMSEKYEVIVEQIADNSIGVFLQSGINKQKTKELHYEIILDEKNSNRQTIKEIIKKANTPQQLLETIDSTPDVLSVLKALGITVETINDVILPPDILEKTKAENNNNEKEYKEKPGYDKVSLLVKLLIHNNITKDEIWGVVGKVTINMMREQSYAIIYIPACNKTVVINNDYGEGTYVLAGLIPISHLTEFGKQHWKSEFNTTPVGFSPNDIRKRNEEMTQKLFDTHEKNDQTIDKQEKIRQIRDIRHIISKQYQGDQIRVLFGSLTNEEQKQFLSTTYEIFAQEYNKNSEKKYLSVNILGLIDKLGGNSKISRSIEYIKILIEGDKKKQANFEKQIQDNKGPKKTEMNRLEYNTMEHWKKEFNNHPEWLGKSTSWITQSKNGQESGGSNFYSAFRRRINKQISTIENIDERQKEYNRLFRQIFPPKQKNGSDLNTIEHWKEEFNNHSERLGKSILWMQTEGQKSGGSGFYRSFTYRISRKVSTIQDPEERKKEYTELMQQIFPNYTSKE